MRGVDLAIFDFDFDCTWAALFLDADGHTYGRYGSRGPDSPSAQLSLKGLDHALREALLRHRQQQQQQQQQRPPRVVIADPRPAQDYPAASRLPPKACIHCHQVSEFRRQDKQATGMWKVDDEWVYPPPENVGLTMDIEQGNRLDSVLADSAAAKAGLAKGDILHTINRFPIASIADVQYALQQAPAQGELTVAWQRGNEQRSGNLLLPRAWRVSDISWRWSLKSLAPAPQVHGEDLSPAEKRALGLDAGQLAFRQGNFITAPARHAGIRINDVIVGVDGKTLNLTARQFDTFLRLSYRVGDTVTYNILRDGKSIGLPLQLQ